MAGRWTAGKVNEGIQRRHTNQQGASGPRQFMAPHPATDVGVTKPFL
jgi:hypothetical protein